MYDTSQNDNLWSFHFHYVGSWQNSLHQNKSWLLDFHPWHCPLPLCFSGPLCICGPLSSVSLFGPIISLHLSVFYLLSQSVCLSICSLSISLDLHSLVLSVSVVLSPLYLYLVLSSISIYLSSIFSAYLRVSLPVLLAHFCIFILWSSLYLWSSLLCLSLSSYLLSQSICLLSSQFIWPPIY